MVTIAIEHLSVSLGARPVLQDITAVLEPGRLIGVIGPNGAGKSTLARAMLKLLRPHGGTVRFDGRDLASLSQAEIALTAAYLPQGQTLHWPLSVERLVSLGRLPHLGPMSAVRVRDREAVRAAMVRADIAHMADRNAMELSGGERARVMLARALACEASALIADEPLASLDPGHRIDVMELLANEARSGRLVVVVLHDLTIAAQYCDRLLLIDEGRLIADGPPADVLTQERLKSVYGITARIDFSGSAPLVLPTSRWQENRTA